MAQIDMKECSLLVLPKRNASSFIVVKFGDGTFTFGMRDTVNYELDRGILDDVRLGDEVPVDVSFTGKYEYIQYYGSFADTDPHTLLEAMEGVKCNGEAISWAEEANGEREPWLECPPYCVQLEFHHDLRVSCPNTTIPGEMLLFPYFRADAPANVDTKAGTIQCSGKCNVIQPVTARVASADWPYEAGASATPYQEWPAA